MQQCHRGLLDGTPNFCEPPGWLVMICPRERRDLAHTYEISQHLGDKHCMESPEPQWYVRVGTKDLLHSINTHLQRARSARGAKKDTHVDWKFNLLKRQKQKTIYNSCGINRILCSHLQSYLSLFNDKGTFQEYIIKLEKKSKQAVKDNWVKIKANILSHLALLLLKHGI